MNKQLIEGNWNVIKGKLKQKYAQLTDDDLVYVKGKEEELLGRIQARLGKTRDEVEREFQSSDFKTQESTRAKDIRDV